MHVTRNGKQIPTEVNARVIALGSHRFIACTCRDISERANASRRLFLSQGRYRQVAKLSSDYFYSCVRLPGQLYKMEWVGGAVETITGYTKKELLARGCWLPLIYPPDLENVQEFLYSLGAGDHTSIEYRLVSKSKGTALDQEYMQVR